MNENNLQLETTAEATPETYPMSEELIGILAEVDQQITALNAQWQGALILFLRIHKLQGNWRAAPNHKEIMRVLPGQMGT